MELAATASPNCGVSINQETLGHAGELRGITCLVLASGQGVALTNRLKVFQRWESYVEVWRDDVLAGAGVRIIRDERGRHWLLKRLV